MAYKFQLGSALLSGSVQIANGFALSGSAVSDNLAASIVSEIDAGEIPIAKLAATTISGKALGNNLDNLTVDNSSLELNTGTTFNGSAARTISVKDNGITNAMLAGSIANSKLANSTISGKALGANLDNFSPAATGGLAGSAYNGSTARSDLSIDLTNLPADAAFAVAADKFLFYDVSADTHHTGSFVELAAGMAGNGLAASSGVLAVGVDDSSIELNGDAVQVKALGVTNAMLAGSIANAKLANSDVTIGSTAVALGGTQASLSGLQGLDFQAGNRSLGASIGNNNLTVGGSDTTVIIAGNLTVQGDVTSVDSTTINITSSLIFEGPADAHETTLHAGTPIQDIRVLLPEYSSSAGGHDVKAAVIASGGTASEYLAASLVTAAEFALLDGGTARGTSALANGDGFLHNDGGVMKMTNVTKLAEYVLPKITGGDVAVDSAGSATIQADAVEASMLNDNVISGQTQLSVSAASDIASADELLISDGGAIKRVAMSGIKTFIGTGAAAINPIGDGNASLQVGLNVPTTSAGGQRTWTLPNSADMSPGEVVIVKAYGNADAYPITIERGTGQGGDQEIEGVESDILLESANAAISLYYAATNTWIIV